jgi:hypothetical protein
MVVGTKLFQLKEWLTIRDAARQLTLMLNEDVSEADIYQLALDGNLILSVYLPNEVDARKGRLIQYDEVKWNGFPQLDDCEYIKGSDGKINMVHKKTKPLMHIPDALLIDGDVPVQEARWLRLEEQVSRIDGLWDLAMMGAERLDIEHLLLQEISGLSCDSINLEGVFLINGDMWANPQAKFKGDKLDKDGKNRFYPAGSLDRFDHILVIKQGSIIDFLAILNSRDKKPKGRPSKLSSKEIAEIKKLHKEQSSLTAEIIANQYGVSASLIRQEWN